MFSFYTSTIPEIPNSHISDDPLDSQTIILKQFYKNEWVVFSHRPSYVNKIYSVKTQRKYRKRLLNSATQNTCRIYVQLLNCAINIK
jgi:hypothetical protein